MIQPGKVVWEGISWFVVAFAAVIGIVFFAGILGVLLGSDWPMVLSVFLAVGVLIGLPTRAILRELRRQRNLVPIPGLDAKTFDDGTLGRLVRSEDDPVMWETQFTSETGPIPVRIFGEGFPEESLLASARQLRESIPELRQRLSAFKLSCFDSDPLLRPFADEIDELEVDTICFFDPAEPDEAEVFYSGGHEDHAWRGGLEATGTFTWLSFDR